MFFIEFWWKADLYFCMAPTSLITYDLNFNGQKFEVETEVEGKGKVTLPGLFWADFTWTVLISFPPPPPPIHFCRSRMPNPATEQAEVQFEVERPTTRVILGVFDLQGTLVHIREVAAAPGLNKVDLDLKGPHWPCPSSNRWKSSGECDSGKILTHLGR